MVVISSRVLILSVSRSGSGKRLREIACLSRIARLFICLQAYAGKSMPAETRFGRYTAPRFNSRQPLWLESFDDLIAVIGEDRASRAS